MRVIMDEFDKVFLSYWKILNKLTGAFYPR